MAKIIVFSGIDSSGKSTQIQLLRDHFDESKTKYKIIWSRGGYTSIFEFVKKVIRLFGRKTLPKPGRNIYRDQMFSRKSVSNIWYTFAMIDLIRLYAITFRIYRLLGYTIIADRYLWDTYVDFSISLENINISKSFLWKIAEFASPKPFKSILFYVDAETSLTRSNEKKEPYSDTIEVRKRRVNYYDSLVKLNKWDKVINTKESSIKNTQELVRGVLSAKK